MIEKVIWLLVVSFVVLSMFFAVATAISPTFRESGAAIVGVILGGYVSLLGGGAVGAFLTQEIRKNKPPTPKE